MTLPDRRDPLPGRSRHGVWPVTEAIPTTPTWPWHLAWPGRGRLKSWQKCPAKPPPAIEC